MEFLKAFYPILVFLAILCVVVWLGLAWYFGFSWA